MKHRRWMRANSLGNKEVESRKLKVEGGRESRDLLFERCAPTLLGGFRKFVKGKEIAEGVCEIAERKGDRGGARVTGGCSSCVIERGSESLDIGSVGTFPVATPRSSGQVGKSAEANERIGVGGAPTGVRSAKSASNVES